jgi:hypothetical protein
MIPRRLNFICRGFGALCLFHLNRSLTYEDGTECSETAAHKIQAPGITTYEYEDGTERVCSETSAQKIQTPGNHLKE